MFQMPHDSEELNRPPHKNARAYPKTCGPFKELNRLENWLDNFRLPRAPRLPTAALPEKDYGQDIYYSGSGSNLNKKKLLADILSELECLTFRRASAKISENKRSRSRFDLVPGPAEGRKLRARDRETELR